MKSRNRTQAILCGWAAEQVKDLRTRLDLTQAEFAETVKVSVSSVRAWERDARHPKARYRRALRTLDAYLKNGGVKA